MTDSKVYAVDPALAANAWIDQDRYEAMYRQSIEEPDAFWAEQAKRLEWMRFPTQVKNTSFALGEVDIRWFEDGVLNVAVNCLDRHLATRGDQTAIIWEGDDPNSDEHITYRDLYGRVGRFANALRAQGVQKGDVVTLYMPMIPEAAVAMLACARIGAVHSIVFGGFSPDALVVRVEESGSKVIITADEGRRGGRAVALKSNVDKAVASAAGQSVETVIVVKCTGGSVAWNAQDLWFHELCANQSDECPAEPMQAEDPLFILYTSGSTGKPKGLKHTTGGYLVYTALTHQMVFDYKDGDVYWCTADVGWITGHSYIVYGPLANGATTLMFEGVPTYPDATRFGRVIEKHGVNQFYTAPTAIRSLMAKGDDVLGDSDLSSLRILGSVGEPINPEAWEWYHRVVGDSRCPIVDSWWQTETGAMMITPMPSAHAMKPGYASFPYFGVEPALLDEQGQEIHGEGAGYLVIKRSWPGQIRTVYGDHQRLIDTYFSTYPGYYFTGDGALRDADGYLRITGRVDDVLNISGHRMGTAEIESALVQHKDISEAAVVGYPHPIKGQGIYCYVTPVQGVEDSPELRAQLVQLCVREIGPIAKPDIIQWAPGLPKTRSGKIMRRILRKVAENELDNLGDTSTLADPSVVEQLIDAREGS